MNYIFNKEKLFLRLTKLSKEKNICFALSICERLKRNYIIFSDEAKWGNSKTLENGINYLWTILIEKQKIDSELIKNMCSKIEEIAPDTEDIFDSENVSYALNASAVVYQGLQYLLTDNIKFMVEIATNSMDTIDHYVQIEEDMQGRGEALEKRINQHELMQAELKRQEDDLFFLETTEINGDTI